jgi:ribosomal protein S18 acetylase RimI-like enzyme
MPEIALRQIHDVLRVIGIRLISSQDADVEKFADQFLGLRTVYDQAKFPYSIVVDKQTVVGLVVAAREPRELVQPAGSPFVQIHIFRHSPTAVQRLLDESKRLATSHRAAFVCCVIDDRTPETAALLEKAGFTLFDESFKMGCPLEVVTQPATDLTFTRTTPEDAPLILKHLVPVMVGSPDHLMQASVKNISKLPSATLNSMLGQMEVMLVRHKSTIVGILSLTGPAISMLGLLPSERGKGYGRTIAQWAVWHLAQEGHPRAWLRVSVDNKPAVRIYERLGFRTTDRMKYYLRMQPPYWQNSK